MYVLTGMLMDHPPKHPIRPIKLPGFQCVSNITYESFLVFTFFISTLICYIYSKKNCIFTIYNKNREFYILGYTTYINMNIKKDSRELLIIMSTILIPQHVCREEHICTRRPIISICLNINFTK